jgi:coniferyl-aldehyde dehydrogenase
MSTLDERADSTVEQQRAALGGVLDRQRQAFMDDGPPGVALRRNRIDRLRHQSAHWYNGRPRRIWFQ